MRWWHVEVIPSCRRRSITNIDRLCIGEPAVGPPPTPRLCCACTPRQTLRAEPTPADRRSHAPRCLSAAGAPLHRRHAGPMQVDSCGRVSVLTPAAICSCAHGSPAHSVISQAAPSSAAAATARRGRARCVAVQSSIRLQQWCVSAQHCQSSVLCLHVEYCTGEQLKHLFRFCS